MKIAGIRTKIPRLSGQDSELESSSKPCSLGTGIGIEFKACAVSEPDSESCSSHGQSRNRNRNRVPRLDSLRTGIGIEKTGTGNLCSIISFFWITYKIPLVQNRLTSTPTAISLVPLSSTEWTPAWPLTRRRSSDPSFASSTQTPWKTPSKLSTGQHNYFLSELNNLS